MLTIAENDTELKPYKSGDFNLMRGRLRDTDKRVFQPGTDVILDQIASGKINGSAVTFWAGGIPIGIGAVVQLWPGIGEAMAWTTREVEAHGREFSLAANAFMNVAEDTYGLHRLQCTVLADFDKAIKWMERMGFEIEGTLRKYTRMGEDCLIMARVS